MRYVCEVEIPTAAGASGITSAGFDASYVVACSAAAVSTSTLAGTLAFQFSNDDVASVALATNWIAVTSATVSVTAASVTGIQKFDVCYRWLRLVYTNSSGTGNLTATIKTIGF